MREPHHYVLGDRKHCVVWYENDHAKRSRKTFSDANEAEVFYQQKLLGVVDKLDLILKQVITQRTYVASGKIAELEKENAKLRAEAEALKPRASNTPATSIRLFRPELAKELGLPAAVVFHQLCWLHKNPDLGKVLDDGKKYIFNTYREWKEKHFPFWSVPTLERAFKLLEDRKFIASKQPDGRTSRRKYYRPLPEAIKLMDSGGKDASICEVGIHQIEPSKASICDLPLKTKRERYSADVEKFESAVVTAATTATNYLDLVKKMKLHFPDHNVIQEYEHFSKWNKDRGFSLTPRKFGKWMLRAEKPIERPTTIATAKTEPPEYSSWFARKYPDKTAPAWAEAREWLKNEFRERDSNLKNQTNEKSIVPES